MLMIKNPVIRVSVTNMNLISFVTCIHGNSLVPPYLSLNYCYHCIFLADNISKANLAYQSVGEIQSS